jgi:hypothetical protein
LLELVDLRQKLDLLLEAGDVEGRSGLGRSLGFNRLAGVNAATLGRLLGWL